ncbi:MAG: 50S ribosomal protein L24 [Candidatus Pacebacteria bacterium]|nr:50S ribosomal protein L24 [Candidatus Paceibacterota bacterium]
MKIKKGDNVLIIAGKDKGKKAKVLRSFPSKGMILVEGVNIKKTHKRPKKQGEKGQIVEVAFPLICSKAQIFCSKCDKPSRIGYKITEGGKTRICKKCGGDI